MKAIGTAVLLFILIIVSVAKTDDFIVGAYLDPYSAHGDTLLDRTIVNEYFDSLKSFGANRVIGWGDSASTNRGKPTALGSFKVIAWNSPLIHGSNPLKGRELVVTPQEPKTLEQFTNFGWHMTLEVEKRYNVENDLKQFGYGFLHQPNTIQGDTVVSVTKNLDTAGYVFAGPGGISELKSSALTFSPHLLKKGTWGRADYVLKLDTTGASSVPDTAVVARLAVYNGNQYRYAYQGYESQLPIIKDTSLNSCQPDTFSFKIYLCHDTLIDTSMAVWRCGKRDTYRLKYDDPVLYQANTTNFADAFVRDLRKADFCRPGEWETLSVHFFQPLDAPFQYSLYWMNRVSLTANRVIVSNDTGRVFFGTVNDTVFNRLQSYYSGLQDTIPRMYLWDEPYGGSYQVMRRGKDLIACPGCNSTFKPTNTIAGYTAPPVNHLQWDLLHTIAQVEQYNLEVYPINCAMLPDSTTNETDDCSIQKGFAAAANVMSFLSTKSKPAPIGNDKPFWPFVQISGFKADGAQKLRIPTYNEVKAQVNLALAYGAKGILYYQYTATGDRDTINPTPLQAMPKVLAEPGSGCFCVNDTITSRTSGVVRWNGTKYVKYQPLWDSVKSVNVNILKKLGPTLVTLTWDKAGPGRTADTSTNFFLNSATSDKFSTSNMFVEVAHFTGGGADYFMLVNRRCKFHESQTVTSWLNKSNGSMWYVIDVLTGDTVLTGGTTGGAPFTTLLKPAEGKLFKVVPAPQYINDNIDYPLTWQGKITLDGDVTVASGKTLKILPPQGQLSFLANRDTLHSGADANKCEFIVGSGAKLIAAGNSSDPLKFLSSSATPGTEDWRGLRVLFSGSARFQYCHIRNAYAGISYETVLSADTIKNVHIAQCKMYGIRVATTENIRIENCGVDSVTAGTGGYGIYVNYAGNASQLKRDTVRNSYYGMYINSSVIPIDSCQVQGSGNVGIVCYDQAFWGSQFVPITNTKITGYFTNEHFQNNWRGRVELTACNFTSSTSPLRSPDGIRNTFSETYLKLRESAVLEWGLYGVLTGHNSNQYTSLGYYLGDDPGNNSIYTGSPFVYKYVYDADCGSCTNPQIRAESNQWNAWPPLSTRFSPNIDYNPYLPQGDPKLAAEQEQEALPKPTGLFQNYPNPFNPTTLIQFNLAKAEKVRLEIFNILGQKVRTLLSGEEFAAGPYRFVWDGRDAGGQPVSSGMYVYRLSSPTFLETKKMMLVK